MKKTWLFGMALTLGLSNLSGMTQAQYASQPYGSSSLAPSGYAVVDSTARASTGASQGGTVNYYQATTLAPPPQAVRAQPAPLPYAPMPYAQQSAEQVQALEYGPASVYGQNSVPAQLVRYPQEPIPAPTYDAKPESESGWIGPNGSRVQSGAGEKAVTPAPSESTHGSLDPAYANALAPTATNPSLVGNCGSGACGDSIGSSTSSGYSVGQRAGWLNSRSAVPGKAWFAGGGALMFRRVDDRSVGLTYDSAMPTENAISTGDARQTRLNGFEVFGGRYFNCGRNALVLNYWGLYPGAESAEIINTGAGSYRSRYHFNGVEMPSQSAYDWFDGAYAHRVVRNSQYQNFEANLLGFAVGGAARTWGSTGDCGSCGSGCAAFTGPCNLTPNLCGSRLNWTWLGGFRWFRFTDKLQYAASETDAAFNGGIDDIYYDNNVRNDLFGFQLGSAGTYCVSKRVNLYALSKAGIYNNHSQLYTRIGSNGSAPVDATISSGNLYNGQGYLVNSSQNNAAVLGELGTGMGARISKGWSANVGYRVIGASGVATAVNTIPMEMIHLGNVGNYNTTSSVILHGVTIGGMYNF